MITICDILRTTKVVGFPSETRYDIEVLSKKVFICLQQNCIIRRDTPKFKPSEILTSAFQYGIQVVSMN